DLVVTVLNPQNGQRIFRPQTFTKVEHILGSGQTLYLLDDAQQHLQGIDIQTGRLIWTYAAPAGASMNFEGEWDGIAVQQSYTDHGDLPTIGLHAQDGTPAWVPPEGDTVAVENHRWYTRDLQQNQFQIRAYQEGVNQPLWQLTIPIGENGFLNGFRI